MVSRSVYITIHLFLTCLTPSTGIPFNQTDIWRLQIAELGQQILGDRLIGLQAGNEPDLYVRFVPKVYFEEGMR